MSIRIAHLSDTHLDDRATVAGRIIIDAQGRNIRGEDRRRCFRAAAEGAIKRGCNLILHAGDLFEHNKPLPSEYCAATEILDLWTEIPAVILADNHGNVESLTERHAIEPLARRRPNLYVSVRPELLHVPTSAGPVQVATLPSPRRSVVAAKDEFKGLPPEAVNAAISRKLCAIIRSFRAQLTPELPAVLMFHGHVQGAWITELQQARGSEQIALTPDNFEGWDYVALGDFHGYQQVAPNAWYSGATDRTSFNEEHQRKGWICAEMIEHSAGKTFVHEFIETPARRYATLSIDELRTSEALPEIIYRIKGQISQGEYDALGPDLARWRQCELFSDALEITRQTRARSEAMHAELSDEDAIRLWRETNSRNEDLDDLLLQHRRLVRKAQGT